MIFTRTKGNKVHSTQTISTKIPRVSTSDKTIDVFLHEAFWHALIIYSPMLQPYSWVLLSVLSDNGSICVIRDCRLRPITQHVPQNNTWALILNQTILKPHTCEPKKRHCLQDLSVCKLPSSFLTQLLPVQAPMTLIFTWLSLTLCNPFKGLNEGEDVPRKNWDVYNLPFLLQKTICFSLCSL